MSAAIVPSSSTQTRPTANDEPRSRSLLSGARADYPCDLSVPDLFAQQAAASPDAIAIAAGAEVMTYAELEQRANRLARYLIDLGVSREGLVAICLDRSPESVVSALAVLKAGGAFLPLDPAYPAERLQFMMIDANPRVLITRTEFAERFREGHCRVLLIDSDEKIATYANDTPAQTVTLNQLAYLIYTSGSTGRPKGVEITHESLLNLVYWHQREFAVTAADRASHLAGVGFDATVWEVWPYLTAGASLHLPEEITRVSPDLLRDWLVASEITISFLPTALAERVMTLDWPAQTALRFMLTGADTLHRYPQQNLPFEFVNNYGPTECTVVATSGRVQPGSEPNGLPAIGRAIANTRVYLLDENLQQVIAGESGELCIGGVGVARGYRNRPDLTAERFIPDLFSAAPGARLYRTGDLARYLDNGEIAYLGRVDEQIKILGYRIEPREIEAALDRHPAIQASVVVARGPAAEEKRLSAYLVTKNGDAPASAELRTFLQSSLPDFMVPAVFVRLHELPLTPNGKVDRAALPDPDTENTLRDDEFVAPRTPIEERLATILSALLNVNEVSVNDNFFLLGGHSLLGTQLIAKIRAAFSVELGLRTLFDTPSIAGLAEEIERLLLAKVEAMSEEEVRRMLA